MTKKLTRRGFMTGLGVVSAGAVLGPGLWSVNSIVSAAGADTEDIPT